MPRILTDEQRREHNRKVRLRRKAPMPRYKGSAIMPAPSSRPIKKIRLNQWDKLNEQDCVLMAKIKNADQGERVEGIRLAAICGEETKNHYVVNKKLWFDFITQHIDECAIVRFRQKEYNKELCFLDLNFNRYYPKGNVMMIQCSLFCEAIKLASHIQKKTGKQVKIVGENNFIQVTN